MSIPFDPSGLSHALLHRSPVWATLQSPLEAPRWFASRLSPASHGGRGAFGLLWRYVKTYGKTEYEYNIYILSINHNCGNYGYIYITISKQYDFCNNLSRHPQDEAADTKEQWNPFHRFPEGQVVDQSIKSRHESRNHLLEIHVNTSWLLVTIMTQVASKKGSHIGRFVVFPSQLRLAIH